MLVVLEQHADVLTAGPDYSSQTIARNLSIPFPSLKAAHASVTTSTLQTSNTLGI